jgi:hypothetical protein
VAKVATVVERIERRRDYRRRIAVDMALSLADMNAGWGDYERAIEHLAAADQLTGGVLANRLADLRESWAGEAQREPLVS